MEFCSRICKENAEEINRIQRENNQMVREINRLKDNTQMFKFVGHDARQIADRIAAKKVCYTTPGR